MSRRSTRLLFGGYYHSDEESDSSSVTNISYRENPVKVFKKKSGGRKRRGGAEESPAETTLGASPSGWSAVSRSALRKPALTLVPPPLPPPSPVRSRPVLHIQLQGEAAPSAVDSSGYSSSEDRCKRPSSSSGTASCAGPQGVYREWLSGAVSRLKDAVIAAVTGALGALQSGSSRVVRLVRSRSTTTPVTGTSSSSSWMKKLLYGLLLIFIVVWWTSVFSARSIRTGPSLAHPAQSAGPPLAALDAATVSAAVEAKMQHIQKEMQVRHDHLLAELKQQVQLNIQALTQRSIEQEVREQMEAQVEQRLAEVQSFLQTFQAHSDSTTASLLLKITALKDQVSRMEQRVDRLTAPELTPELEQALGTWLTLRLQEQAAHQTRSCGTCDHPLADKMADFALESQGASVVSTRCSETYRTRSACVTLFGLPMWYPSESPRTVIQGPAVLLPGKCWAFHGVQGTLVIALSHPIHISHVTLDHLPRHSSPTGRIQSAPKDFQVYGMTNETEEGTLVGTFRYQEDGEPTQTFSLSGLTDAVYRMVELRVLSNWGHVQYTCVYRFRVHGQMSSTEDQ